MSIRQKYAAADSQIVRAFCVVPQPGCLSSAAVCANVSERTAQHSTASTACPDSVPVSAGGNVNEPAFSFYHCAPVPQEPQITVLSDVSDQSDKSDYTVIASAARDFIGWITVNAYSVIRSAVRAFRRGVCEVKAVFNRRVFILEGGLRL